ncbi:putative lipoprotein [Escherichia coli]|uniref:Putative lipoprotein n=1 Tax=Escherichia coli TaxID=562 RepID=A0A376MSJ2_ECOLX|nr:putative lipoprotein [Escherichia coli]
MTFRMSSKNFAYLNDSLCAIDEDNKDATVYQSGLYNAIVYHHTGKKSP